MNFCFPDKDLNQRKEIRNQFYLNFTDIILESIKGLGTNRQKLKRRFKLLNPEILEPHYKNDQSVVIYSQHYNNWEWGALTLGLQMSHHVIGIVKKISNGYINDYVQNGRTGANVSVVIMEEIKRLYSTAHDKPVAVVFIADQVPFRSTRNHLVSFFNQNIQFHKGAAIYAYSKNTPVYSYDIHRVARGQYEVELTQICLEPKEITPQELTQKYVKNLETLIQKSPSSWLWSHRRFKTEIDY